MKVWTEVVIRSRSKEDVDRLVDELLGNHGSTSNEKLEAFLGEEEDALACIRPVVWNGDNWEMSVGVDGSEPRPVKLWPVILAELGLEDCEFSYSAETEDGSLLWTDEKGRDYRILECEFETPAGWAFQEEGDYVDEEDVSAERLGRILRSYIDPKETDLDKLVDRAARDTAGVLQVLKWEHKPAGEIG